jgi:hypothetical protein
MMAAFRQPKKASVTGFPSDVMNRAETGSASICVFVLDIGFLPPSQYQTLGRDNGGVRLRDSDSGLDAGDHDPLLFQSAIPVGVGQSTILGDIVIT